ncbi:SLC22A6, partial [Symbiodinium sp. KB8]
VTGLASRRTSVVRFAATPCNRRVLSGASGTAPLYPSSGIQAQCAKVGIQWNVRLRNLRRNQAGDVLFGLWLWLLWSQLLCRKAVREPLHQLCAADERIDAENRRNRQRQACVTACICGRRNGADILGYVAVLGADVLGRKAFQSSSFFLAAVCLLFCAVLQPGWNLIACAMVGRICLNVCFTTIYVALATVFPESSQKNVLPLCQITARVGGILAPMSGTLPAAVSCPAFGSLCMLAVVATLTLPERIGEEA